MKRTGIYLILSLLLTAHLLAQRTHDVKGGKDYPMISRFNGSHIAWYQNKDFDRYFMLRVKDNQIDKYEVDGKIFRIQYEVPKSHSIFEIYKSYENALLGSGFEKLLLLDKTNCGVNLSELLYVSEFNGWNALPAGKALKPDFKEGQFIYFSARKKTDDKNIYVVVYITEWDFPVITFDVIEVASMKKDLVTVRDLDLGLQADGHCTLQGIYFDTGKASITGKSAAALTNIAQYLKAHPDKKYLIVGHTDNTGKYADNMLLSQERAKAVVAELTSKYGIPAGQLQAVGVGPAAPVTTNQTDEGRAKNRRVEIVAL